MEVYKKAQQIFQAGGFEEPRTNSQVSSFSNIELIQEALDHLPGKKGTKNQILEEIKTMLETHGLAQRKESSLA